MTNRWNLSDHTKKESFKTPSGYFETFTPRVMQRIAEHEQQKKVKKLHRLRSYSYTAAAVAVIFLVFGSLWMSTSPSIVAEPLAEDTYLDDMINYAMLDDYTINEYILEANQ